MKTIAENATRIKELDLQYQQVRGGKGVSELTNDEPIKVWTYFLGNESDALEFATEWEGILEREVTYDLTSSSNGETSWYCETMATKKQIFDYDMDSDWMTERN